MRLLTAVSYVMFTAGCLLAQTKADSTTDRGMGFAYRNTPCYVTLNGVQTRTAINLVTVDLFSYNLTKKNLIGGLNFHYGVEENLVEVIGTDIYYGKRIVVMPYMLTAQLKTGVSLLYVNYDLVGRDIYSNHIGAFVSGGMHVTLFQGLNLFGEWEVRGISPAAIGGSGDEGYAFKFDNSVPNALKKFKSGPLVKQGVRIGATFYF